MGRFADEVPTRQNVGQAIANLKPSKKAAWRQEAQEKGWCFEDFVIEKIRKNIEYRTRRQNGFISTHDSQQSAGPEYKICPTDYAHYVDSPATVVEGANALFPPSVLAAFGTQQLEEELAVRKRRRHNGHADEAARNIHWA